MLADLDSEQRAAIERCRAHFEQAGGFRDEHSHMFILRFLLVHKWDERGACKHLDSVAAWRRSVGADELRRGFATGQLKLMRSHAKLPSLMRTFTSLPQLGETVEGELLKVVDVGGIDVRRHQAEVREPCCRVAADPPSYDAPLAAAR